MTDGAEGPVPTAPPLAPGWYDDPAARFDLRYHNGFAWTGDVSHEGQRFVDPVHPTAPTPTPTDTTGRAAPNGSTTRNPLGTAAMVLGIISICLAWLPLLVVVGAVLAVIAVAMGAVARRRARSSGLDVNRAVVGLITGGIGLACTVVGVILTIVLFRAIDRWENPADHEVELTTCELVGSEGDAARAWRATGRLTNRSGGNADFTIKVIVSRTGSGGSDLSATEEIDDLAAGETIDFEINGLQTIRFEPVCDVEMFGPRPFDVDLG